MKGWDQLRQDRHSRLISQKLISPNWQCSPSDVHSPCWDKVPHPEWEDARMATYASQITIMDRGIGRILDTLNSTGMYENTIVFFLSDNGGCAEHLKENGEEGHWPEFYGGLTRDGRPIQVGNRHDLEPGGEETFMSYDLPWANASNAPFRLFKSWVHEGGIATPFVVHWPATTSVAKDNDAVGKDGDYDHSRICHTPWAIMDIVATCCELAGVPIQSHLEGESFAPVLYGDVTTRRQKPIFWEHQGNRAVRDGQWKLVYWRRDMERTYDQVDDKEHDTHGWELYNMENDRTELNNLASKYPQQVQHMIQMWKEWAKRCGIKQWPLNPTPDGEKDWSNFPWMW